MTFESIIEAWLACEAKKKSSPSCVKFRWHAERDLAELWRQMSSRAYEPRASMVFIVTYPVLREVWAGAFRDRVAHHWEALRFSRTLEDAIVRNGNNSMNCRKGYGALKTVGTFVEMLKAYTNNYTRDDCWIVGGDFANFFMSIDKAVLWRLLLQEMESRYTGDDKDELLYMMERTLFHRCRDKYYRRSHESKWEDLPPRKSLFYNEGLPIGNLPSQLWANFLGSFFMRWMMMDLGYREFLLFVDDWRALVRSQEEGRQLLRRASEWLWDNLRVTMHPDKVYLQHYTKGCRIVGRIVKPHRVYVHNRTYAHFAKKMRELAERAGATGETGRIAMLAELRSSANSYLGLLSHHSTYKRRRRICEELILPTWGKYVYFAGEYTVLVIRKQFDPIHSLRRKLRKHNFAAKFIRPKWQEQ